MDINKLWILRSKSVAFDFVLFLDTCLGNTRILEFGNDLLFRSSSCTQAKWMMNALEQCIRNYCIITCITAWDSQLFVRYTVPMKNLRNWMSSAQASDSGDHHVECTTRHAQWVIMRLIWNALLSIAGQYWKHEEGYFVLNTGDIIKFFSIMLCQFFFKQLRAFVSAVIPMWNCK